MDSIKQVLRATNGKDYVCQVGKFCKILEWDEPIEIKKDFLVHSLLRNIKKSEERLNIRFTYNSKTDAINISYYDSYNDTYFGSSTMNYEFGTEILMIPFMMYNFEHELRYNLSDCSSTLSYLSFNGKWKHTKDYKIELSSELQNSEKFLS